MFKFSGSAFLFRSLVLKLFIEVKALELVVKVSFYKLLDISFLLNRWFIFNRIISRFMTFWKAIM